MPKLPRNINGNELCKYIKKYGYEITRQTGSHIRFTRTLSNQKHHLTIPNHKPIKIETLNKILTDVANNLKIKKEELINNL